MQKARTGKDIQGSAMRSPPPPEGLQKAFAAYTGGNLPEAERLCRAVTASRPDLFDAWHLLGVIQSGLGKSEKALISYDRALTLRADAAALTNRGAVLHDLGRFAQALESYDAALMRRPDFVHALTNRGITLHAMKRFAEALAGYESALAAQSDYPEALARRGAVLHELSRFEEALGSYDRALALRPRDPETLYNRGTTLGQLHRLGEALESYDRALELRPDYPEAIANRRAAVLELKRFEQASANFDRALALSPTDSETRRSHAAGPTTIRSEFIKRIWNGEDPFLDFPMRLHPPDHQGWNSDHFYLAKAMEEVRPQVVVELGVWKGGSVNTLAAKARELGLDCVVIGIDTFLGSAEHWVIPEARPHLRRDHGYPRLYYTFVSNVIDTGLSDYVLPLPLDSVGASNVIKHYHIQPLVLHVDAGHDYRSVRTDLESWWPLLAPGGILVGDDYYTLFTR